MVDREITLDHEFFKVAMAEPNEAEALRIAELVLQCSYNYWLDILDSQLLKIPKLGLLKGRKPSRWLLSSKWGF